MPRRNRSSRSGGTPAAGELSGNLGWQWSQPAADGDWLVRSVPGTRARKPYRCPGCDHEIAVGRPHLVAWRRGEADLRRHWHPRCWRAGTA
jgi:hypothetical protein